MRHIVTTCLLFSLLLLTGVSTALAQERTVTGTVIDADTEEPIPGANVVIDGTTRGTTTNIDGEYSLDIRGPEDIIAFSFVGYETQRIQVGDQEVIDVALQEDVALLEDVVVVGYGERRRQDISGSVSSVDVASANVGNVTNPDQLIQGRVSGVNITPSDGGPGAGTTVRIRGTSSIGASNEPLYVIDGVPIDNSSTVPGGADVASQPTRNPLNFLNPNDIESIDILKDASAAAIYGSRGSNGVILIQTKQGQAGQVRVDYDGSVTGSQLANSVDILTGSEYRDFVNSLAGTEGGETVSVDPRFTDGEVESALEGLSDANTDWQDVITRTAVSQEHNLAISGGTEATQYRASVSYAEELGIVENTGLERLTGRVNARNTALEGRFRTGLNLTAGYVRDNNTPQQQTGGFEGDIFLNVFQFNPTQPVMEDGEFFEVPGQTSVRNPLAMAEEIRDFARTTRVLGNIFGELDLIEGLTARVNVGLNRETASRDIFLPRSSPIAQGRGGEANVRSNERYSVLLETTGTYRNSFIEGQNLEVTGGYSWQEFDLRGMGATGRDFVSDAISVFNVGSGEDQDVNPFSFRQQSRLISFFGRVNYDIDSKYLLAGSLRRDGSSRFGDGNRWGLFPAGSIGWRLSDEPFMDEVDWLNNLLLRFGVGVTGSQEIGIGRSLATFSPGIRNVRNGQEIVGANLTNFPNPDLGWEETTSYNLALDYGMLGGRFQGALEVYRRDTDDLLLDVTVPEPTEVGTQLQNIGSMRNEGVEFNIDAILYDRQTWSLSVGGNIATNRNEVLSLREEGDFINTGFVSGPGQTNVNAQRIQAGRPIGSFYGPVFLGLDQNGNQVFELDEDGNRVERFIGNAQPDFNYGLNVQGTYQDFDFSLFLRGVQGIDIFNNLALLHDNPGQVLQRRNLFSSAIDSRQRGADSAVYSDRWIQDGSFLRIDNVTVGYTLPDLPQVRNARLSLSVNNLYTFTSYTGWDPEVNTDAGLGTLGMDFTSYPRSRSITFGVNVSF